jgi:hypothetical protein
MAGYCSESVYKFKFFRTMKNPARRGNKVLIFRPYFRHPKTGKLIYPKNGRVFPMWVDAEQ